MTESNETDGRTRIESQYIYTSIRPSVTRTLLPISFALFFGKQKHQQKSRQSFYFRISDYLNIHKYCDYFVSIIVEIQKIRSQEYQSTIDNHYRIRSFNIGPFRQKQLHHCRMSSRGGHHQGSSSILQDSRRVDS